MRIRIAVDSKRILEALNYDLPSVSEMNQMKYEYLEPCGSWPQDKIRRLGRSNTASILRSMVDKWLDTGRTMDGGECPSKRSLDGLLRWRK